jgi:hypothetical protein
MMQSIQPKNYVAPGTGLHTTIAWILFPFVILVTILITYGMALIAWLIAAAMYHIHMRKARALMRGSALLLGPQQFPEIHAIVHACSQAMGLPKVPEVYLLEDNQQNAFAVKYGGRQCVVLVDDIVFGAEATGNRQALAFIIAHELAHHALGHTGLIRGFLRDYYKPLGRLDELSCDAVAHAVINDPTATRDGLTLLLVGPQLFARVNQPALAGQAVQVDGDKFSKKAERSLSHPLLLRRYARLLGGTTA